MKRIIIASALVLPLCPLGCTDAEDANNRSSRPGADPSPDGGRVTDGPDDHSDDDDDDGNTPRPSGESVSPDDCGGVLALAESCFERALSAEQTSQLAALAASCEQGLQTNTGTDLSNLQECVVCLEDIFLQCKQGHLQVKAQISECAGCDDWTVIRDSLPDSPVARSCAEPEREVCDGEDNDCDGEVDDGHVCPDESVVDPLPFTGRMYLAAVTSAGQAESVRMQPVWPSVDDSLVYGPFVGGGDRFRFGPDDTLYYYSHGDGFFEYLEEETHRELPTEACPESISDTFGIGPDGSLYYSCKHIYRDGQPVAGEDYRPVLGVLADGHIVSRAISEVVEDVKGPKYADDVVLLDPEGNEVSRLSPHAEFGIEFPLWLVERSCVVRGDQATIVFTRETRGVPGEEDELGTVEYMIYNLHPDQEWRLLRHFVLDGIRYQRWPIAAPDGTFFLPEDLDITAKPNRITVYLPDGTTEIVGPREQTHIHIDSSMDLTLGP